MARAANWPPVWAWVLGTWALLVAAAALLEQRWGLALETCLLRRTTGVPCPTCGSTRSVLALLRGDVAGSLQASPLLWIAGTLLIVIAARRFLGGPSDPRPGTGIQPRHLLLGLALLLANWVWVLTRP